MNLLSGSLACVRSHPSSDQCGERGAPNALLVSLNHRAASQFSIGEAFADRVEFDRRLSDAPVRERTNIEETFDLRLEALPDDGTGVKELLGQGELRSDPLEGQPVDGRVAAHEASIHLRSEVDQICCRIGGARRAREGAVKVNESLLRQCDDEAGLRSEEAVHRTCRCPGRVGHSPNGEGVDAVGIDQSFRGIQERRTCDLVVFPGPSHLDMVSQQRYVTTYRN